MTTTTRPAPSILDRIRRAFAPRAEYRAEPPRIRRADRPAVGAPGVPRLTDATANELRHYAYANPGASWDTIAAAFGVSHQTARMIVTGAWHKAAGGPIETRAERRARWQAAQPAPTPRLRVDARAATRAEAVRLYTETPMTQAEIAAALGVAQSFVSYHVRAAGVAGAKNRGAPRRRFPALDAETRAAIRALYADGWTQAAIADRYGTSQSRISRVVAGVRRGEAIGA